MQSLKENLEASEREREELRSALEQQVKLAVINVWMSINLNLSSLEGIYLCGGV